MSLRYGLLGLLNYSPATGYDLKKTFDDSLNFFWQAHKSQIYKELTSMEKEDMITAEFIIQNDKPNKKLYSITEKGKDTLIQWLKSELDMSYFVVRNSFLMKIFFAGKIESKIIIQRINDFIELHKKILEKHKIIKTNIERYSNSNKVEKKNSKYWLATENFGFEYSKMCIKWGKNTIKILQED